MTQALNSAVEKFTPAKRVIKLKGGQLYLTPQGDWTSDISQAQQFTSVLEVAEAIARHGLKDTELVSFFKNSLFDLTYADILSIS